MSGSGGRNEREEEGGGGREGGRERRRWKEGKREEIEGGGGRKRERRGWKEGMTERGMEGRRENESKIRNGCSVIFKITSKTVASYLKLTFFLSTSSCSMSASLASVLEAWRTGNSELKMA